MIKRYKKIKDMRIKDYDKKERMMKDLKVMIFEIIVLEDQNKESKKVSQSHNRS